MRANLQHSVAARKDQRPHQILGVPADADTAHILRSYHLLSSMCSDDSHLRGILRTAFHAMNHGQYRDDSQSHSPPYQPFASKTQYWFWHILSNSHEVQEITWPVPHNLKPHVDQGAKNNGAWAKFAWITRTPMEDDGQEEEQVPAFTLHGQLFDHIPLNTDLKAVGATRHNGTWHVPFFHPSKPKDPSKQWNAVLTWFYMHLPKMLNPDAVRSKSRPSVNNNTVIWTNGTKMKPTCFAKAWKERCTTIPLKRYTTPGGGKAIKAPRHLKRYTTPGGGKSIKAPRHLKRYATQDACTEDEDEDDDDDEEDTHGYVMNHKCAIKGGKYRGKRAAALTQLHQAQDACEEDDDEDEDTHGYVMNHKCAIKGGIYRGKRAAALTQLQQAQDACDDDDDDDEEEEVHEEEDECSSPRRKRARHGGKKSRIPYMAKQVRPVVVPTQSKHSHAAWEQHESDVDSSSDSDSELDTSESARHDLLQNMVEHKMRTEGPALLKLPTIVESHTKVRYAGFSSYAQWVTDVLSKTLRHYSGALTLDNCADTHVHEKVCKALGLPIPHNTHQGLVLTTQLLQLHQHIFE